MQNDYLKQIFSLYSGYVYEFCGVIPENVSAFEYVTNLFVEKSGNGQIQTSVVQLNNGKYILHSFENVEDENFINIADLSYQPPILPEEEPAPEEENTQQGGQ